MFHQPAGIGNKAGLQFFIFKQPDYLPGKFPGGISDQNFFSGNSINTAGTYGSRNYRDAAGHGFQDLALDTGTDPDTIDKHGRLIQIGLNILNLAD